MPEQTVITLRTFAPKGEFDPEFFQLQLNRIAVSHHKYGWLKDTFPHKVDALSCAANCMAKYRETGNTEYLVDAANYVKFEFMFPSHPMAFFKATDSSGSAGVVLKDGTLSHTYTSKEQPGG